MKTSISQDNFLKPWLKKNHTTLTEVWLIHYKKSSSNESVNHFDAVEEALCFEWIDSKLKKIDDERFILKYSPRKPQSVWLKINKATAEQMVSLGKMTRAGLEKIEVAKKTRVLGRRLYQFSNRTTAFRFEKSAYGK